MIRIYIFTYAGDHQEALECVRCACRALPGSLITVVDDKHHPCPDNPCMQFIDAGATGYAQSSFPRNGNLNGRDCVLGVVSTLARNARKNDIVVKLDSDTCLLDGGWIKRMQRNHLLLHATGFKIPSGHLRRQMYGLCYALKGEALTDIYNRLLSDAHLIPENAPEDIAISECAMENFQPSSIQLDEPWSKECPSSKWTAWNWWSCRVTPEKYKDFSVVTFGSPMPTNLSRSLRALKMRELRLCKFSS